jgi:hypothetical protein
VLAALARREGIDMPIVAAVDRLIAGATGARDMVGELGSGLSTADWGPSNSWSTQNGTAFTLSK